ncbi:MAG TPA: acyl-CoA synthetase [Microthrixaceae bacterium]|nr:acyl-CoA synthetase [Microthrixaceae bacterium]
MGEQLTYNLADQWEAISDRVADREALVCGERRLTFGQLEERANRLANHLIEQGVKPGDLVGCYLTNGTEYIEALLACFKVRAASVNINYRYVSEELLYLLTDAQLKVLICNEEFVDRVAEVAPDAPLLEHTLVVGPNASKLDLSVVPGGLAYDDALASSSPDRPQVAGRSGDDLYVLYTGGTTGMPKGVVWDHNNCFFGCIGGGDPMRLSGAVSSPEEMLDRIIDFDFVFYALAPLMHAAAQWVSFMWLFCGAKVVLNPGTFDPVKIWQTVGEEKVSAMTLVGDAMARPLIDAWNESGPFDVSSMYSLSNGGAPMAPTLLDQLRAMAPDAMFTDGFGSSETGIQGSRRFAPGVGASDHVRFENVEKGTTVIDADGLPVKPGSGQTGRVAHTGYIPLRYLNAPEKTAETFVELHGVRYVVSGDMGMIEEDGSIVLLGRGSTTINTGGEKVHPEEVESKLKSHPGVYDALVVGVADDRWGQRVVAVVQPSPEQTPTLDELVDHLRGHLAGYKIPRVLVTVESIQRSPSGKADYRWAGATAREAVEDSKS